ncbi:AMP-binding protein [Frigidibacter sp. SD6-1]|uniref:AMP-binding protein n=1 Tax=Frigidibacter sp. SD6-1 TaxID=3032581 RepID=UPI0024DFD205|nr:AMP-binding protein [Frigidibacter sp. SD6-1]
MAFFHELRRHGRATALLGASGAPVTYENLAARADLWQARYERRAGDIGCRLLIGIEIAPDTEMIAAYLGALSGGHAVLLAAPGEIGDGTALARAYRPNMVVRLREGAITLDPGSDEPAHPHPDLRLLLSTSGSTGDPKLVRLSEENIDSNARAIADYLSLRPADRGLTTLPLHYSYGLSVLHSHLVAGASLRLDTAGASDPGFERLCREGGITNLAFVPHQLDLLEARGSDLSDLPGLRFVTQAGGRFAPEKVRAWAGAGRRAGWDFVVMYGQTEAAPRMAYLPPAEAIAAPDTIGRAIPGGRFRIEDEGGAEITGAGRKGELVYQGPNVMMGYAERREALADGRTISDLRTGDIAEWNGDGLIRLVGRVKRFVKLYGLRLNLDQIDAMIDGAGLSGRAVGLGDRLAVMTDRPEEGDDIAALIAARCGLPLADIFVGSVQSLPRLGNGKTDYREIERLAAVAAEARPAATPAASRDASLAADYAAATRRRRIAPEDTFASLGGDSLAYLHLTLAIEDRLGHVPPDWDRMSVAELDRMALARAAHGRPAPQPADPAVITRLGAIACVILFHLNLWPIQGGTWLLILLAGYSLARFQSGAISRGAAADVLRNMLWPILPIYFAILLVYHQLRHDVPPEMYLLVANNLPHDPPPLIAPYWFISLYAQIALFAAMLGLLPFVRRAITRDSFNFGLIAGFIATGASALMQLVLLGCNGTDCEAALRALPLNERTLPLCLPFLFIGWAMQAARDDRQRLYSVVLLVLALAVFPVRQPGFLTMMALGTALLCLPIAISLPARANRFLRRAASATLFVYLVHNGVVWAFKVASPAYDRLGPFVSSILVLVICFGLGFALDGFYRFSERKALRLLQRMPRRRAQTP